MPPEEDVTVAVGGERSYEGAEASAEPKGSQYLFKVLVRDDIERFPAVKSREYRSSVAFVARFEHPVEEHGVVRDQALRAARL